ncbi:MAG: enoyl-CoA hydratase [Candidatus Tectimicrobiota bacterium]|nr:MAG: enoyl-CoA hydratase [Candidatus Tectomicrobia bacterium]
MDLTCIRVQHDGPVTTLTIDRPQVRNALDLQTAYELRQAVEATRARPELRVLVITGAGEQAFVGGADLHELERLDAQSGERFIRALHEAFRAIRTHPAPVIAAVNGHALGAGLELVVSCDVAIAAAQARLGMPEVRLGLPSVIEAALLPQLVGLMRARELLLTGDPLDAWEAYRIGLVTQVVPQAELPAAVRRMAERLMRCEARALTLQKELLNRWLNLPMEEAIEAGIKSLALACATEAPRQAIAAFWAQRQASRPR